MSITTPHPTPAARTRTPPTLARLVGGAARGASRRPKLTIFLWLALVVGCLVAGGLSGTHQLSNAASGTGESASAEARLHHAGLIDPATRTC
jgi:ferric-dicitrate binding protein FerR (iron transport regulator)